MTGGPDDADREPSERRAEPDRGRSDARPPAAATRDTGPTLVDAAIILALAYTVGAAASATVRASLDGPLGDAAGLATFGVGLGVAVAGWSLLRGGRAGLRAVLGPRPVAAHLGVGLAVGVGVGVLLNVALPPLAEVVLDRFGLEPPTVQETARQALTDPVSRVVAVVGVVVVAPFAEELAFRGAAFRALRRHLRLSTAAVASTLLFAGLHTIGASALGAAYLLVILGVAGVVLAVVVDRQGHLWGAMLAHAAFNGVAVTVIWLA